MGARFFPPEKMDVRASKKWVSELPHTGNPKGGCPCFAGRIEKWVSSLFMGLCSFLYSVFWLLFVAQSLFRLTGMNYYNYFTEIEEHFVRRRGKHLLVSPMDWGLIASWRDAGVPLHVALRGIDVAMDAFLSRQHRGNSKVNSLCYCHDSVMTEYASHLESRIGESSPEAQDAATGTNPSPENKEGPELAEVLEYISGRIDEIKDLAAKQYPAEAPEGIQRVIARLEEVKQNLQGGSRLDSEAVEKDFSLIDQLLVEELRACIPPEQADEWEKEAKKELKVYKKRLPKETFAKIHGNFMRDKIHKKFGIGELSLFRL